MISKTFSESDKASPDLKPSSPTDKRNLTCWIASAHLKTTNLLTCLFPENLSGFRKSVLVSHHNNQGYNDVVAFCSWLNNSLQCLTKTGYTWDASLYPDRLTIHIPRVAEENIGATHVKCRQVNIKGLCRVTSESGGTSTDKIFPVSTGSGLTPINKTSISTGESPKKDSIVYTADVADNYRY
ncbi:uncharacterized protein LOC112568455 [Pomacea canaliculata]|uniref:uncharacterized protein LOC112568455 n=1 Tax=Pomacea canaliculata TaxID=400727 RepID=UPI000D738E2B|nr:uncharacterized protein LOC112568455 [Pomacea canaliculata]